MTPKAIRSERQHDHPVGAGVLAWAGIRLSSAVGAILMSVSTIVVALNAQLLRRVGLAPDPA